MRSLLLVLCLVSAAAACGPPAYVADPAYPAGPVYVYTEPGGGCWADDVWYGACPWYAGPNYGYYWYGGGRFTYRPGYVWRDHRAPPPRIWRPAPAPRPPVIRDHRRR